MLVGVAVGFVVFVIAAIVGGIPHLQVVGQYDGVIGLVAGLLTFVRKWDFNF